MTTPNSLPSLAECVVAAWNMPGFVEQYDRLRGTNLLRRGPLINVMIDDHCGKTCEDFDQFCLDVKDLVLDRLPR